MNNKGFVFLALLLLSVAISCQKEKTIERDYPQIRTAAVNNITEAGARFNGVIISGNAESITEYGFVWGPSSSLNLEYSEKVVVNEIPSADQYSCDITFALQAMKEYYVRSYVKADGLTIYGDAVKFMSLGSSAPQITDFEPKSATWGDTVTIYGKNFSYQSFSNMVYFGEFGAKTVDASNERIRVIVPNNLTSLTSLVSVEVLGNRVSAADKFELITPGKIISVNKVDVTWGDTLELSGIFPFSTHTLKILINNMEADVIDNTEDNIKITVPNSLMYSDSINIALSIDGHVLTAPKKLHLIKPYIESIEPSIFGWTDTILLKGFFNPIMANDNVFFSGKQSTILEADRYTVKCVVPSTASHNCKLTFSSRSNEIEYPLTLDLMGPIIYEVTPKIVYFREYVTIKGKYFLAGNTKVNINNINCSLQSFSPTQFDIYIDDFLHEGQAMIKIDVYNKFVQNDNLSILSFSVTDFYPTKGTYGDIVTIIGTGFIPDEVSVELGFSKVEIIEVTENRIRIRVPNNLETSSNTFVITCRNYVRGYWEKDFNLLKSTVTSISTLNGRPDDIITITGNYFNPDPQFNSVIFHCSNPYKNTWAEIVSATVNKLTVRIPALDPSTYAITVQTASGSSTYPDPFTITSP